MNDLRTSRTDKYSLFVNVMAHKVIPHPGGDTSVLSGLSSPRYHYKHTQQTDVQPAFKYL